MSRSRKGNMSCCVVGCTNTFKSSAFSFYRFPKRPHDVPQRELWITAVRRMRADGSPWAPSNYTRICSAHFVGNKKSMNPRSISFFPTIFPKEYEQSSRGLSSADRSLPALRREKCAVVNNEVTTVTAEAHFIKCEPKEESSDMVEHPLPGLGVCKLEPDSTSTAVPKIEIEESITEQLIPVQDTSSDFQL